MKTNFYSRMKGAYSVLRGQQESLVRVEPQMATQLSPIPLPEAKKGQTSLPSFRTQPERTTDVIRKTNRITANTDATTFRTATNRSQQIRNFLAANPDFAATVNAYLRVGIPKEFRVWAENLDGRINSVGTALAHQILNRITYIGDPTLGYNPTTDLQSMSESLGRELLLEGAMCLELVLDDMSQPLYPSPIAVSTISFKEDSKKGVYPVQIIGGDEIDLDIPTVFYVSIDQDLLSVYAVSVMDTAIRAVLADEGFSNFLQRQLKRNISPRMVATIIEDKLKKSVGIDMQNDPDAFKAFVVALVGDIQTQLEDLEPEDAMVVTDAVTYDLKAPGGTGAGVGTLLEKVYSIFQERVTASLKSSPAVLGRDSSSGSATTSTYLFMKSADMVATKLSTLYSRMLTQAVRLMGEDCIVKFEYAPLDLRPKGEQEAYQSMRQDRIMELWSVGLLTDEQASIDLMGRLPPAGFKTLSGTMFHQKKAEIPNTTSQTSLMNGQKDNLKSDAPTAKKGGQNA